MRKIILAMLCIAAFMPRTTLAIAASQAWVMKYCADHGMAMSTNANGRAYTYVDDDGSSATFQIVKPTHFAIVATNCDDAAIQSGVTNGMRFAFHRPYAVFANVPAQRHVRIDVDTNTLAQTYIYNSWTGTVFVSRMWMTEAQTNRHFRIYGTRIFEDEAHSLTNGFTWGGIQ